jgi:hypothetical protein
MGKQRRKAIDRTINVSSSEPALLNHVRTDLSGNVLVTFSPQATISKRVVHIRIPTGGRAKPEREKPFTHVRFQYTAPQGYVNFRTQNVVEKWSGTFSSDINAYGSPAAYLRPTCGFPMSSGSEIPFQSSQYPPATSLDLKSQAEVKALLELDDKSGKLDFDLGVFFGERKETAEMFRDGAVGLLQLVRALKRGDAATALDKILHTFRAKGLKSREVRKWKRSVRHGARDAKQLFDVFSNTVLLWNLGISPLMRDLEALHQRLVTGDLLSKCQVKARKRAYRVVNKKEQVNIGYGGGVGVNTEVSELSGYTVTLIAVPHQTVLADLSRLGLTNLPALAWELTPASFIVDYFYAFGPWLQSLKIPERFVWQDGSYTHRVRRIITTTYSGAPSVVKLSPGVTTLDYTKRSVYTTWPTPIPPLSLKGTVLSDKQTVNTGLVAIAKVRALLGIR